MQTSDVATIAQLLAASQFEPGERGGGVCSRCCTAAQITGWRTEEDSLTSRWVGHLEITVKCHRRMCVRHGLDADARYGDTAARYDRPVNYASLSDDEEEEEVEEERSSNRVAHPSTSSPEEVRKEDRGRPR